jgi:small subunit ribosomal protein S6
MIVLDPNLDEASVEALTNRISNQVTQRGGTVEGIDRTTWGRRRLAYPIGRYRDGLYVLLRLRLSANVAAEIKRSLHLTESVIRHLLVRAEPSAAPAAASARA